MNRQWLTRMVQVAVVALTTAAICQELEKPKEERTWHGKIAGFIPYDFRLPTIERFKKSYWNPYDSHIFTRRVMGIGWTINLYALLERLNLLRQASISELDFLMPTPSIKEIMEKHPLIAR